MSIGCMIHVWWNSTSSGNDRLTLLAIADEADDEGRNAFPSMRRLAQKVNCHVDTIVECVKRLEASGELKVDRPEKQGRGRYNRYKVVMEKVGNSDHSEPGSVEGSVEGSVRTGPNQNGAKSEPKRSALRPFRDSFPSYPQDGLARMPERRECDACDGTTLQTDDAGLFIPGSHCPACSAVTRAG